MRDYSALKTADHDRIITLLHCSTDPELQAISEAELFQSYNLSITGALNLIRDLSTQKPD